VINVELKNERNSMYIVGQVKEREGVKGDDKRLFEGKVSSVVPIGDAPVSR
jgi:hypothetical protein